MSVRGPHGLGKTALASWVVLWFALTRDGEDWKIPMTASAWRQLSHFLLPELHKWARKIRWDKVGRQPFNDRELMSLNLKLRTGEAFALASDNAALIEGAHAAALLYLFDESKTIPVETWDAAEGAMSTGDCYWLAISTPGEPQGRFYEIHSRKPGLEDWHVRHVTKDESIAAGRISQEWAEQRLRQWGKGSAVYQNRVEGEFATSDAEGIIPLAWVEAAIERWRGWADGGFPGRLSGVGIDVGGGTEGSDKTVFALCYNGTKIKELRKHPRADPDTAMMEIAGLAGGILRGGGQAVVDAIGIGAGVCHRLAEQGFAVLPFVASKGTGFHDRSGELGFTDWRSAAWWLTREMLEPESGFNVCLPDDDELIGDLTAPHMRRVTSASKIQVESKDDIRKRLGRSTDCGDAVIQVLVGPTLASEDYEEHEVIYRPVRIGREF